MGHRHLVATSLLLAALPTAGCWSGAAFSAEASAARAVQKDTIDQADSDAIWRTLYESENGIIWDGNRGFNSPAELRVALRHELAERAGTDDEHRPLLSHGWLWAGMSEAEAMIAMGEGPLEKTTGGGVGGRWEAWHYYRRSLYFHNGRLTSWIEHEPY